MTSENRKSGNILRHSGLWRFLAGSEPLDIDFRGAALALFDTLNQAKTVSRIQLGQELDCFPMGAIQILLYLIQSLIDKDAALFIVPAILG